MFAPIAKFPQFLRNLSRKKLVILILCAALVLGTALGLVIWKTAQPKGWQPLSQQEIAEALERNEDLPARKALVVDSAVSLVDHVSYFWGGKSDALGWDDRWGQPAEVTGKGSSTTGTIRPFGLDCSGFVTWCFIQSGYSPEESREIIGNGTYNQWENSRDIDWDELQVGDFAFQRAYPNDEGNHIGICVGFDKKGRPLFAHCASSINNTVVTHADGIFTLARRPNAYFEDPSWNQ